MSTPHLITIATTPCTSIAIGTHAKSRGDCILNMLASAYSPSPSRLRRVINHVPGTRESALASMVGYASRLVPSRTRELWRGKVNELRTNSSQLFAHHNSDLISSPLLPKSLTSCYSLLSTIWLCGFTISRSPSVELAVHARCLARR